MENAKKDGVSIYKTCGANIRKKRKNMNLTTEQLAKQMGISNTFLGLIERGERGMVLPKLVKLSRLLNTTIDELITETESEA